MSRVVQSAILVSGGMLSDTNALAAVEAVQTSGTHVGTMSADYTLAYSGQTVSFYSGVPFAADAVLYAALNTAGAPVTWSN